MPGNITATAVIVKKQRRMFSGRKGTPKNGNE